MRNFIGVFVIGSFAACGAGLTTGCSVIGYVAGGAIDGPMNDVDSVTATLMGDGKAGYPEIRFRYDSGPLKALLKEISAKDDGFIACAVASSTLGFTDSIDQIQVEIVTQYVGGRFQGATLGLDSVRVLQQGPHGSGRYALFPEESVSVKLSDNVSTVVSGTVSRLGERHIVLHVGDVDRGFALRTIDTIRLSDSVIVAGGGSGILLRGPKSRDRPMSCADGGDQGIHSTGPGRTGSCQRIASLGWVEDDTHYRRRDRGCRGCRLCVVSGWGIPSKGSVASLTSHR